MKDNKTKIIILISLVILIIIFTIINLLVSKKNNYKIRDNSIGEISKQFFSEYIFINKYELIEKSINNDIPLVISVDEMLNSFKSFEKEKETKIHKECDLINSWIYYSPYRPVSKDNVKIKIDLHCTN